MFVRSIFLLLCSFLLSSCFFTKKVSHKVAYKGDVLMCNSGDNFKFYFRQDSASVNIKLYTELGIKVADVMVSGDSSYVRQAYNSELEKNINFYLQKYHASLCLDSLLVDFFSGIMFEQNNFCYQVEKLSNEKERFFYNIYNLKQERLFSVEKIKEHSPENDSYRIFNESFCIKVYLK